MKICYTGGGTLGHVYPAIAIKESLDERNLDLDCYWIGRDEEQERSAIEKSGIDFYLISSGKLRRYWSVRNISDIFRIIRAYRQSLKILKKHRVDLVFSKGGFVSVPVVYAAHKLKIKVVTHESDRTLGLATKLNGRVADKVLLGFKNDLIEDKKYIYTGNPIRASLSKWLKLKGEGGVDDYARVLTEENESFRDFYSTLNEKFVDRKPVILVTGGSLGALEINNMIWNNLDTLLERYNIYHQMGKTYKKIDRVGYVGVKSIGDEIGYLYSKCDLCISRSGAGTLNEILKFNVNSLLIPLLNNASRGEQVLNATYFEDKGLVRVLRDRENTQNFIDTINDLINNKASNIELDDLDFIQDSRMSNDRICDEILSLMKE
ncbi:MAG: UDP-N-acetylglucosamine--N-acetylmuramyl-(pentapeptide) pyrophosphoryl-undecaprenol N-acetylglucosamine transferase [Sphaerochaetaceae bacterium]|nr:UDP-N-acetylglucosamine--N-acetylmuramyl-(pentapeptide) pyrophosphoryl-undecaprenol N-acetylglucosamine transferase [Sphaerochaetaceae bacterium]